MFFWYVSILCMKSKFSSFCISAMNLLWIKGKLHEDLLKVEKKVHTFSWVFSSKVTFRLGCCQLFPKMVCFVIFLLHITKCLAFFWVVFLLPSLNWLSFFLFSPEVFFLHQEVFVTLCFIIFSCSFSLHWCLWLFWFDDKVYFTFLFLCTISESNFMSIFLLTPCCFR